MESAALPQPTAHRPSRIELGLIALLLAVAAAAWASTSDRMAGMDAGPGTDPGTFGFYLTAWVVMMAAMMFPSAWPTIAVFARVQTSRRAKGRAAAAGTTPAFVCGYLIAWTAWGLLAFGAYQLGSAVWPAALAWNRGGPYVAGGVIAAAALYQLTPLKNACLTRCRSPLTFLMTAWRNGRLGALRMGVEHGVWCVGCCWGLMAALFALGAMSIGWMAFVAGLIAIEKLLPWRAIANYGIAVLLLVLGTAVAASPASVPGLTLPGSMAATERPMTQPPMQPMTP